MTVGDILSTLSENYSKYVIDPDCRPLKQSVQEGETRASSGSISDTDRDYLLSFNQELPLFHELPFRVLFYLPSMMTEIGSIQVTYDNLHFWAWTAEVLKETNQSGEYIETEIEDMFCLVVDLAVGGLTSIPISDEVREENRKIRNLTSPHAERAMRNSHRAATQLSYPLLEGTLRRICCDYVELDGIIKPGKKILKIDGSEKKGGRANNLGNLLYHYENRVADIETKTALKSIRSSMEKYSSSKNGYEIINSWRHPHSHGGERFTGAEHMITLNIVCQIIWSRIPREKYDEIDTTKYTEKISNSPPYRNPRTSGYYPLKETEMLLRAYGSLP